MIDERTTTGAVTLHVNDVEKQTDFYTDVIGLETLETQDDGVTLGTAERPLLHLRHLPDGQVNRRAAGLFHLALRVPSRADLAAWFHHYAESGTPNLQGASDHGVSEAIYLSDVERNGIEVYRDRLSTEWDRRADGSVALNGTRSLDLERLLDEHDGAWDGIPAGTDMGHIHLKVPNLDAARRFYVDVLGFEVQTEMGNSALFISAGGYHHHLGINTWHMRHGTVNTADTFGLAQFDLQFADETARDDVLKRVSDDDGVQIHADGDAPIVTDPFDNKIRLIVAN